MMAAFTAVVVVQWLWIKYAIRERENKTIYMALLLLQFFCSSLINITFLIGNFQFFEQLSL